MKRVKNKPKKLDASRYKSETKVITRRRTCTLLALKIEHERTNENCKKQGQRDIKILNYFIGGVTIGIGNGLLFRI